LRIALTAGAAAVAAAPALFWRVLISPLREASIERENINRGILVKFRARFGIGLTLLLSAAGCYGQATTATSDHRDTAIRLEQTGQYAESESEWHKLLTLHPASAEAYAHLGLLEARQEHYKEAVPLYRKALALDPRMPGLRLNLGLSLFKSGAMKEAIVTFTPLLKSLPPESPDSLRVTTLIGLAHYSIGEYAAAIPFFKTATAHDPQNLPFRMSLAQSCLQARQYQCVLDVYQEILTLNAESAEADMLAGEALDEMKNTNGAIEQFRAAVKADPRLPNAHFGLGYLLWTQNQFEEAAREFQAELVNVPDNPQALTFLADCGLQLGKSDEALPLIEKAIQLDSNNARAHMDLGVIYASSSRPDDALREFKTAVKLAPEDANVHWRLARLYQSMGRKDEAKVEFDITSSLHKAENDSIFTKLKAAQDKGKPAESTSEPPASN
jgi:tetratricopeptide (TPR) repeat protein